MGDVGLVGPAVAVFLAPQRFNALGSRLSLVVVLRRLVVVIIEAIRIRKDPGLIDVSEATVVAADLFPAGAVELHQVVAGTAEDDQA
ncbi:hypothetical protein D3C76_1719220 [compost metagenome]